MGRGTKTFDRLMALSGAEGSFDKLTTSSKVEGPQEYCVLVIPAKAGIEDFEPKPDNEFGRQPKFCHGLGLFLEGLEVFLRHASGPGLLDEGLAGGCPAT